MRYIGIASAARPYFQASKGSPVADFIAEAHRHPVFELTHSARTRHNDMLNPGSHTSVTSSA